jgi:hypothetical protein
MEQSKPESISAEVPPPKRKYVKKSKADIQLVDVPLEQPKVEEVKIEPILTKQKREANEKTKAALAKGREKLAEINKQRKAEREAFVSEKINKKAERIADQKVKMLKDLNLEDEEEDDESIVAEQPRKASAPKTPAAVVKRKIAPKRVVYIDEQEDDEEEEEVVYKSRPPTAPKKKAQVIPAFSGIQFY